MNRKMTQNKNIIKNIMNQVISFSPSNIKSKNIFGRNNNTKLFLLNEPNIKSMNNESKIKKQYFSNKNIIKPSKKIIINEYNYKTNLKYK